MCVCLVVRCCEGLEIVVSFLVLAFGIEVGLVVVCA